MFDFLKPTARGKSNRLELHGSVVTEAKSLHVTGCAAESMDEHDPAHFPERLHEGESLQLPDIGSTLNELQDCQLLLSVEASFGKLCLSAPPGWRSGQVGEGGARASYLEGVGVALDCLIGLAPSVLVLGLVHRELETMNIHLVASIGGVVAVTVGGNGISAEMAAQSHDVRLDGVTRIRRSAGERPHPLGHGVNIYWSARVKKQRGEDRPLGLSAAPNRSASA